MSPALHGTAFSLSSDPQCSLTRNQNLARRDSELDVKLRKDAHRMLDTRGPKETGQSKTNWPRRGTAAGGTVHVVVVSAFSHTPTHDLPLGDSRLDGNANVWTCSFGWRLSPEAWAARRQRERGHGDLPYGAAPPRTFASRGSGSLPMADGRWPPTLLIFLTFTYSRDAPPPLSPPRARPRTTSSTRNTSTSPQPAN